MAVYPFRSKPTPKRPPARSVPKPVSIRRTFELSYDECERFHEMASARWPREGFAFTFWKGVAAARGLDYRTIIGDPVYPHQPITFTALPFNHDSYWCWPQPLIVPNPPPKYLEERPHV